MAGRGGKVAIHETPSTEKLAPMLSELDKLEGKTGYRRSGILKPNRVIGYINEETKAGSKLEKHRVTINFKNQDDEFRSWIGQESIKSREASAKKERKARPPKQVDWLDF